MALNMLSHSHIHCHLLPFIDKELMERTLTNYTMNPLYIYLVGILGKDETKRIFHLYRVHIKKMGRLYCLLAD